MAVKQRTGHKKAVVARARRGLWRAGLQARRSAAAQDARQSGPLPALPGKTVTLPFAVLARGEGGDLSHVQFMEDTFATLRSFRESGAYPIKGNPDGTQTDI